MRKREGRALAVGWWWVRLTEDFPLRRANLNHFLIMYWWWCYLCSSKQQGVPNPRLPQCCCWAAMGGSCSLVGRLLPPPCSPSAPAYRCALEAAPCPALHSPAFITGCTYPFTFPPFSSPSWRCAILCFDFSFRGSSGVEEFGGICCLVLLLFFSLHFLIVGVSFWSPLNKQTAWFPSALAFRPPTCWQLHCCQHSDDRSSLMWSTGSHLLQFPKLLRTLSQMPSVLLFVFGFFFLILGQFLIF